MPRAPEPLVIPFFATGLFTHRSQFFSPYRSIGINVVTYHDAAIDGQDMELTNILKWVRRPGFSRFCSQAFGAGEFPHQFYSSRNQSGNVFSWVDTNQNISLFTSTSITPILAKSTSVQGFIQQIQDTTYYTDGIDQIQYDTRTGAVANWGIVAPSSVPTISSTGFGAFWQPNFNGGGGAYIILDNYGNFQKTAAYNTTGAQFPNWNQSLNGATLDGQVVWTNRGPYQSWASQAWPAGQIIVDSNGNLEEVTTGGTSGASQPSWATVIGNTTTDGTVTWTLRGLGFSSGYIAVGPKYPSTAAQTGGGPSWTNLNNVKAADGNSASVVVSSTSNTTAEQIQITNLGFAIPGAATVSGIKVEIAHNAIGAGGNGVVKDSVVSLIKAGVVSGNNYAQLTQWTNQTVLYGNQSDPWGLSLVGTDVNNVNFGVAVTVQGAAVQVNGKNGPITIDSTASIDFIRVTVYYSSGAAPTQGTGQITAFAGYQYVACYHTQAGHVSTASPSTFNTGPIIGQFGIQLQVPASPDTQCDYVQFYRTADGGGVFYFLGQIANPGSGTVTFTDNFIPDANLVTTVIAPLNHLNDPPPAGMTVMCYWQGRIWGAVGSKLYFNAGPDCVNGIPEQAWPPANVFSYSGPINKVTRTSQGVLVWGSDYVSMALGGPQTLSFYPYDLLEGIGVNSPNCLDQDGDTHWLLSTQGQCWQMDFSGKQETGNYILEIIQNFPDNNSYITAHRQGVDAALYLGDGSTNIERYSFNVQAWSTNYQPVGGIHALASIETSPGNYTVCAGRSSGGGYILGRNLNSWQDDGQNYTNCFVTIGTITMSQPGALLVPCEFIVGYFDAVGALGANGGPSQPIISILPNEITIANNPGFLTLSGPVPEPPTGQTNPSQSLQQLRWPTDSLNSQLVSKLMHHLQIKVAFAPENAPNSVIALAVMPNKD